MKEYSPEMRGMTEDSVEMIYFYDILLQVIYFYDLRVPVKVGNRPLEKQKLGNTLPPGPVVWQKMDTSWVCIGNNVLRVETVFLQIKRMSWMFKGQIEGFG